MQIKKFSNQLRPFKTLFKTEYSLCQSIKKEIKLESN